MSNIKREASVQDRIKTFEALSHPKYKGKSQSRSASHNSENKIPKQPSLSDRINALLNGGVTTPTKDRTITHKSSSIPSNEHNNKAPKTKPTPEAQAPLSSWKVTGNQSHSKQRTESSVTSTASIHNKTVAQAKTNPIKTTPTRIARSVRKQILNSISGIKVKPMPLSANLENKSIQFATAGNIAPVVNNKALTTPIDRSVVKSIKVEHPAPTKINTLREQIRKAHQEGLLKGIQRTQLDALRTKQLKNAGIDHYSVVISGAGPAGLMAAISQADKNRTVCVYESRNEDTWDIRSSVLRIKTSTINNLINILSKLESKTGSDFVFSHKEKRSKTHPKSLLKIKKDLAWAKKLSKIDSISTIQTDVLQRIYMKYINVFYPELIHIIYSDKLEKFDPWLQTAQLSQSGKTVAFDSIIHANGGNSDTHPKISEQLGEKIEYVKAVTHLQGRAQAAYLNHPTFNFTGHLSQNHKIVEDEKSKLRALGWSKTTFPETYIFPANPTSRKIWICGQCPDNLTPEQHLQWNTLICQLALPAEKRKQLRNPSPIEIKNPTDRSQKKLKISASIFTLNKRIIKQSTTNLPFGKSTVIGDARETANFILGEGISNIERHVNSMNIPQPYRNQMGDN
ncbi:NAD(P)/FAD-dependent oxidoreductase [uncultured Endozoicomonas sp.]|uniref:NAD(P)/FAD-dependent oxidoreductase n=1 Tax=uncultured Endozoicomonas sp. TaxID=432652 RepID=UPI00262368B7|nr:NAD(P)/FAD-dependent oxidoreductase [uncultured Endozoicomonas sp.]